MERVLITGGAGYIGSHTAKLLAGAGYEPIVIDNLGTGNEWAVKWGPFLEGDIGDERLVRSLLDRYRIESVIHFAGNAYVGESIERPRKYFRNNVTNSLHLLDAMIDAGVSRIVFSSSCATYGLPQAGTIDENHSQRPVNPYGESKLFMERTLQWYSNAHPLTWVALRYFNAAGADPEGEIGEAHRPETHIIPLAIAAAQGRAASLPIFGVDYETPDGSAVRDYVHVNDLAQAHLRALHYLEKGGDSTAFNLGTGTGHSVRQIQHAVERIGKRRVPVIMGNRRPGDPPLLVANADKARRILGWQPKFTDIDDIIETAWYWHASKHSVMAEAV